MEEERRLAFVAMTRAEQGLYLPRPPDAILTELTAILALSARHRPPAFWSKSGERDDMLLDNARSYIAISERTLRGSADAAAFRPGQRVRHSILGTGTMLELDEAKQAWLIRFDGLPTRGAFLSARGSRRARSRKETLYHDPTGIFLRKNPRAAIAFSGGVDSSYLLYAAVQCGADARLLRLRQRSSRSLSWTTRSGWPRASVQS